MVERRHRPEEAAHFGGGEDDREFELGIGAGQFQFVRPGAVEGLFPEHLDGANGLGAGLAGDFLVGLEVDAILADLLGREQVWGSVVKLTELADAGVVGLGGAWPEGHQLEVIGEGF